MTWQQFVNEIDGVCEMPCANCECNINNICAVVGHKINLRNRPKEEQVEMYKKALKLKEILS